MEFFAWNWTFLLKSIVNPWNLKSKTFKKSKNQSKVNWKSNNQSKINLKGKWILGFSPKMVGLRQNLNPVLKSATKNDKFRPLKRWKSQKFEFSTFFVRILRFQIWLQIPKMVFFGQNFLLQIPKKSCSSNFLWFK